VVYAAADWWLSTVRPAPLWLFSEFGAVYKYSDLLTYSCAQWNAHTHIKSSCRLLLVCRFNVAAMASSFMLSLVYCAFFFFLIKLLLATAWAAYCIGSVRLLVCLLPKWKKMRFCQKLSSLELWCLLTTYRKSYMGFSKNPLLDPWNPRWRRSAILDLDAKMRFSQKLSSLELWCLLTTYRKSAPCDICLKVRRI